MKGIHQPDHSYTEPGAGAEPALDQILDAQTRRWQAGERAWVEDLLAERPELREDSSALLDLIYNEILLREKQGDSPRLEEYLTRFPTLAARLKEQFEVHEVLGQPSSPPSPREQTMSQIVSDLPGEETLAREAIAKCRSSEATWGAETRSAPGPAPPFGYSPPGYEILEEVGRGGMGVVYKAWQPELKRLVALKMLRDGALADSAGLTRFRTEAEAIARLQHANIVHIYEIGGQAAGSYFAMEFVDGISLHKTLAGQPQPVHEAAELIQTLARAIHYAHQRGVIHRDLKPANVLVASDGHPKITDFGLAKLAVGGQEQTQTGSVLGTPSYMAPEQAQGIVRDIGPATDVYALGIILYELLTGRPPFKGESPLETIRQVVADEPVPPSRLRPKLPRDLETICLKCLAKEPRRRYASALELADDLGRFLRDEPILARPAGRLERTVRWARRNPLVAGLEAVLLLVVIAGFTAITWKWLDAEDQRELAEERALAEERQKRKAERAEEAALDAQKKTSAAERLASARANDLEKALFFHTIALTHHEFLANHPARAEELLSQCKPEFRGGWEWRYLQHVCNSSLLAFRAHSLPVRNLTYSPDGRYLASASGVWGHSERSGEVKLWDAVSGREMLVLRGHDATVHALCFSPDSRSLASGGEDGIARIWEVPTGKLLRTVSGFPGWVSALTYSPDGESVVAVGGTQVSRWNPKTGKRQWAFDSKMGGIRSLVMSPDGKHIAAGGHDIRDRKAQEVRIWDAQSGDARLSLGGHDGDIHRSDILAVAYHPDGRTLASSDWAGTVKIWDTATPGKVPLSFQAESGRHASAVAFHPSGRFLATAGADGTVRTWTMTGQPLRTFAAHTGVAVALAFTADGYCLASGGHDEATRVWAPDVDQASRTVPVDYGIWIGGLAFSDQGNWLVTADISTNTRPSNRPVAIRAFPDGQVLRVVGRRDMILAALALHSPSQTLALGGADKALELWHAGTGRFLKAFRGHTSDVTGLAFHPDGKSLVSVSKDKSARLWSIAAAAPTSAQDLGRQMFSVAFSRDGRLIALGGQGNVVEIWNGALRVKQRELRGHTGDIRCLVFSPDGTLLASCGDDPDIRLWDAANGKLIHCLQGHTNRVRSVAFSPDGTRLVSASEADHTVKIWHVSAGKEILTLETPYAFCAAFSPDGRYLVAGSTDAFKIWDTHVPTSMEKTARLRLSASLTGAYFHTARREWLQAADALGAAFASGHNDLNDAFCHAVLLLLAGKQERYQQLCRDLVHKYGRTEDAQTAYVVSRACALAAKTPMPADQVFALAKKSLGTFPVTAWWRHAVGLSHYRSGRFDDAIRELKKSMVLDPNWAPPTNWLTLALCYQAQGKAKEARQWLQKSARWLDHDMLALPKVDVWKLPLNPHEWLACHLLRAEAEKLIRLVPEL